MPAIFLTDHRLQIKLDFPYEFLIGVSGWCLPAALGGASVIRSLTFRTSRGTVHGPFGALGEGTPFEYLMEGGAVVGFSGRSGWHLDAVGLHVAALRPETLCDAVQELGGMAYRSFVHGAGSGTQQTNAQTRRHSSGAINK